MKTLFSEDVVGMENTNNKLYPLSHPQKRIWYTERIYQNTSLYNIVGTIRIKGPVDFELLNESVNLFIKKNDGLRLRLLEKDGEVCQFVGGYEKIKFDFMDFSGFKNPEEEFVKWVEDEAKKPINLSDSRLFNIVLFKISDNDNGFLEKFHHIISDGWSSNLMIQKICDIYSMLKKGENPDDDTEYSYVEYLEQEQKYLQSERFTKDKSFWLDRFNTLPDIHINNPYDRIHGSRKGVKLNKALSSKLNEFVLMNKISLNTFFTVLYLLYLNKTIYQNDLVIGTPVLNRSGKKEKSIFGMFTSTMPFRFTLNEEDTVLETMKKANDALMKCFFHQKYPYDILTQDLKLKSKGYDSLFSACVNYYNTKLCTLADGYRVEVNEFYSGCQAYSFQLIVKDWFDDGSILLEFDYRADEYSEEQVDRIYGNLCNLIHQILDNSDEKVGNLSVLSEDERNWQIYKFNDTKTEYPRNNTIYELFEKQVECTPGNLAIRFKDNTLTYSELNERSNQLARHLIAKGIHKESIVGLLTTHSIETVTGILGVLKAGGAYLPIDAGYPADRINYMLEDSKVDILLVNGRLYEGICFQGQVIDLNDSGLYTGEGSNPGTMSKPENLAYVIYTSGSTGKPKGTMIEHRGLVNYIWWARQMYTRGEGEVFPLYSSLAFDLTVTSVFTPLISGGIIDVYTDDGNEYVLYEIMKNNRSTVVKLTPAHLSLIKDMDNSNSSVKRFIVGGEDLKVSLSRSIHESFKGSIEIYNEYGPTETVVGCMIHRYDCERDLRTSVPIGVPAHNVQIYILDESLSPVPTGSIGELYISGDGVARGYLNRPELTGEKFVDNPFVKGTRMYKTGDLARMLYNGKIEYAGRADHQVKIRGYRIELGEIEKRLLEYEGIKEAVVIDREDLYNSKYLCAYIVEESKTEIRELRDFLSRYLPEHFIPLHYVVLKEIPLTANGKVNRSALPEPEISKTFGKEYVAPRNREEEELVQVAGQVLGIERLGMKDNFFHIGGDSIKAIQIASKLNDKGLRIKEKDILSHPILEEMSLYIENCSLKNNTDQGPCKGEIVHTPIISWFLSQGFANINYYNQSFLIKFMEETGPDKLEAILNELVRHHDSLRINYDAKEGRIFYNDSHIQSGIKLDVIDLSMYTELEQNTVLKETGEKQKSGFDIGKDLLIKACLFDLGQRGKRLLLTAHHLVVDGVSWRILLEDMNMLYRKIVKDEKVASLKRTHSYQRWAEGLNGMAKRAKGEVEYWRDVVSSEFEFPTDHGFNETHGTNMQTVICVLDSETTQKLFKEANFAYGTDTNDLLISSLYMAIRHITGKNEIVIETEGHGREDIGEDIDISRTVGWFTSIYPVKLVSAGNDIPEVIKSVKEQMRRIPRKGINFGVLKYLSKCIADNGKRHIRFNYLGDFGTLSGNGLFDIAREDCGSDWDKSNRITALMEINTVVRHKEMEILLTYNGNEFTESTVKDFLDCYTSCIRKVAAHCTSRETKEFTPSDFDAANLSEEDLDILFK